MTGKLFSREPPVSEPRAIPLLLAAEPSEYLTTGEVGKRLKWGARTMRQKVADGFFEKDREYVQPPTSMSRGSVAVKLLVSVQAHPLDERCPSRIIVKGIENALSSLDMLFTGGNTGKLLVQVSEES